MNAHYAGIDIGSRTTKLVVVDAAGAVSCHRRADTGYAPMETAESLLAGTDCARVMATGYGRNLFEVSFAGRTVTEIKAHARGALAFFSEARVVLDIGGQDSKVIAMDDRGRVQKFEMNDRCAAGTGKFMEVMARTLGYTIEAFGDEALQAENDIAISSMCTVFAESEVTSLIARGQAPRDIALGLHSSVVRRVAGMVGRVAAAGDIVFTGGVAMNPCMRSLLERQLGRRILLPPEPQLAGALGAALLALETNRQPTEQGAAQ